MKNYRKAEGLVLQTKPSLETPLDNDELSSPKIPS